jgi:hypothetical protein
MKISRKFSRLTMLVLFSLVMTGCAGISVQSEQPARSRAFVLDSLNTVGQTFTTLRWVE